MISKKLLRSALLLSSCIVALSCGGGGGNNKPGGGGDDEEEHFATDTLHRGINDVKDTQYIFVDKTKSDYKIIADTDNETMLHHANYLRSQIRNATGANLDVVNPADAQYSSGDKYIVLGHDKMIKAAGVNYLTDDDLRNDGYNIITKDQSIFVLAHGQDGVRLGMLRLLEYLIGYDMMATDFILYNKDGVDVTPNSTIYLPNMAIVEKHDYEFKMPNNNTTSDARYGQGYTDNAVFIRINGRQYHNSFDFVPPYAESDDQPGKTNFEAHRDWFCDDWKYVDTDEYSRGQICYTCHGNAEEESILLNKIADKMVALSLENPDLENITFTQQDCNYHCQCDACKAVCSPYSESENNPANSVAVILFMNKLNKVLQEKLKVAYPEGKTLHIVFFAYQTSYIPPKKGSGNVIHCDDNVGVIIAPSRASYTQTWWTNDESTINYEFAQDFKAWAEFSDRIYVWPYSINFWAYLYPYASHDTMIKDYRFFRENHGVLMMNEGNWEDMEVTGFGRLKDYIETKAMRDVNVNYNDIVSKYFKYNFGDAGDLMRQMYDEMTTHLRYIEETNPNVIVGKIHERINLSQYWPMTLLKSWCDMADEALDVVEKYHGMGAYYDAMLKHVSCEALSPYFMLATLYENELTKEQLYYYRSKIVDICRTYNFVNEYEHDTTLEEARFINWGF